MRISLVITVALALSLCGCGKPVAKTVTPHEVSEFHSVVRDGDALIVERHLAAKPGLVNARDENGKSPLAAAREAGHDDVADVLRKHGAAE